MELCTARGISNLPLLHQTPCLLHSRTQLPFLYKQTRLISGHRYYVSSFARCVKSEETSTETTQYIENEPGVDGRLRAEGNLFAEKSEIFENQLNEVPQEGSFADNLQLSKFLEDLNIELDFEETSSVILVGGGAAIALWFTAAIVGAIDSIPVVPKVLELVGLGYTIWFSSRYLIFKKNRDELVARVEQIKQQVVGSKGD